MVGVKKRVILSNDLPTNPITSTARQVFEGRANQVLVIRSEHAQVFFGGFKGLYGVWGVSCQKHPHGRGRLTCAAAGPFVAPHLQLGATLAPTRIAGRQRVGVRFRQSR